MSYTLDEEIAVTERRLARLRQQQVRDETTHEIEYVVTIESGDEEVIIPGFLRTTTLKDIKESYLQGSLDGPLFNAIRLENLTIIRTYTK